MLNYRHPVLHILLPFPTLLHDAALLRASPAGLGSPWLLSQGSTLLLLLPGAGCQVPGVPSRDAARPMSHPKAWEDDRHQVCLHSQVCHFLHTFQQGRVQNVLRERTQTFYFFPSLFPQRRYEGGGCGLRSARIPKGSWLTSDNYSLLGFGALNLTAL